MIPTRSPTFGASTPGPTASTVPTAWLPSEPGSCVS